MKRCKYTKTELESAVTKYIEDISRTRDVCEKVPTGKKDENGHEIYELVPVINDAGDVVRAVEYVLPPTVAGLCVKLGISLSTWENYVKRFPDVGEWFSVRRLRYLQEKILTDPKSVRGVIFDLENNFGMKQKTEVSVSPETAQALSENMSMAEKIKLIREAAGKLEEKE